VGPVLILYIAFSSISLFACILFLFISFRKKKDLLLLVCATLSAVMFVTYGFSILFSATSTISYSPFLILRFKLIFTQAIYLCMLGALYHLLSDGRRLYIFINSIFFWLIIAVAIFMPDYVLFGESASTYRHYLPGGDSLLMIDKGFSNWRLLLDISILVFAISSFLLLLRNLESVSFRTTVTLFAGAGLLLLAGLFDQMVDMGQIESTYVLPFAGFAFYLVLIFYPLGLILKQLMGHETVIERGRKWEYLVNHSELIVVGLNRMGQVEFLSPYFYELTGYKEDEVIGKDWFEFVIPPQEYYNVQGAFVEILSYEFHPHYLNPILKKNKEERMIRWFNVRTRDMSGQITGSLSIGVDVSDDIKEKESMKRKLEEAENLIMQLNEKIENH
jgi:PAS domain S-box-containing protein